MRAARAVRTAPVNNAPIEPGQVDKATQARFRPVGEPPIGGYSLRVRIIENTFVDVHQTVATKIVGFGDSPDVVDYTALDQTDSAVYFQYRDASTNYHRFNYFQWFAIPGHTNATLEMSVVRAGPRPRRAAAAVRPLRRQRHGRRHLPTKKQKH